MQNNTRNIYKVARLAAGITKERAAELLSVSDRSLSDYESGRTITPNDVVLGMIGIYGAQHLAYQHIMHSSEVARAFLPTFDIKRLPDAILRLQKEVRDFLKRREELEDITYDGEITDEERPRYDSIMKELDDIVAAIMALKFAKPSDS